MLLLLLKWIPIFLSSLITYTLEGYLICLLFKRKVGIRNMLIFAAVNAMVTDLPRLIGFNYSQALSLPTFVVVMFLTAVFLLGLKYLHSIFSVIILMILAMAIDFIDMSVFKIIFEDRFSIIAWQDSLPYMLLAKNAGNLTCLLIIALILLLKMRVSIPGDINRKKFTAIFVNCIITVVFILPNVIWFENNPAGVPTGIFIFNSILCVLLLAVNVYSTIKSSELELLKQDMQMQKLYTKSLNEIIDKLRGFKHDYNNTVQVIGGYLALNDIEGLKRFHSQMQGECRFVTNTIPLNSYVMENPAIYGLLLSKISYSEVNEIQFVLNVNCSLDISSIKIYDFCKVLGILLDNALEAANESGKKYVELEVTQTETKKLAISISNSYAGEIDLEKIKQNGYTTKEGHSGFGLWEVNRILSKYKNVSLATNIAAPLFYQRIVIEPDPAEIKKAGLNFSLPLQ